MEILRQIKELSPKLKEIRQHLHAHPEVSQKETNTQQFIKQQLLQLLEPSQIKEVGNTGLLIEFNSGKHGKTILLRADIDALPIQEINNFSHKSITDGVSHKCGHDGHTTIMMGVAEVLHHNKIKSGKVYLLFQPAEENGEGAKAVLADKNFPTEPIDYVFALHNLPGIKKGNVVTKEGPFTANVTSIIIKLNGKTAHAAEPEMGYNPSRVISKILNQTELETNNNPAQENFFLITPIHVNMGELAYGISAGYGEVHLTIRSWSPQLMKKKCDDLVNFINQEASKDNLEVALSWTQEFFANINHKEATNQIEEAAKQLEINFEKLQNPFKWGEDFGLFTQKYPGAMFGIGSGENCPALHNPDYDYPDDITETGVKMFTQLIYQNLS